VPGGVFYGAVLDLGESDPNGHRAESKPSGMVCCEMVQACPEAGAERQILRALVSAKDANSPHPLLSIETGSIIVTPPEPCAWRCFLWSGLRSGGIGPERASSRKVYCHYLFLLYPLHGEMIEI
jgi:hypothetical protein